MLPSKCFFFRLLSLTVMQGLALAHFTNSRLPRQSLIANLKRHNLTANLSTSTHQSSSTETFRVCDHDLALRRLQEWNDCQDCMDAVSWFNNFGEPHPSKTCAPECCADVFLEAAIGHFRACNDGCCHRLVTLQLSLGLSPDLQAFVIQSQGLALNEAKFVRRTSMGQCIVEEGSSSESRCGPRCATQIQDRTACEGRNTAEIPRFRERLELPPCSSGFPDGPAQDPPTGDPAQQPTTGGDDGGGRSGDEKACFPGNARVTLQGGEKVRMRDLRVGSFVLVEKDEYSQVIGFSHRDAYAHTTQVRITLTTGARLTVSKGHYVYANGGVIAARAVSRGDLMRVEDGVGEVEAVGRVDIVGLFNPQTVKGDIVVDGFVTSTYTEAVAPTVAHALLMPVRALPVLADIVSWVGDGWRLREMNAK